MWKNVYKSESVAAPASGNVNPFKYSEQNINASIVLYILNKRLKHSDFILDLHTLVSLIELLLVWTLSQLWLWFRLKFFSEIKKITLFLSTFSSLFMIKDK